MADEAQDSDKMHDIESQIKSAILSRSSFIRDQADSLTFQKVRRLLEKELGLETRALDAHKQFVKQLLQTCMESVTSDVSNREVDAGGNVVSSTEEQSVDEVQVKNDIEEPSSGGAETMEDSPVMGLMMGIKKAKTNKGDEDTESKVVPNEITIKKAIWAKASYLRENSENITLAGLRRLLEEDLEVEKYTLDPFKKFISQQVDDVLDSSEVPQPPVSEKKNHDDSGKKVSPKASKVETSTSSGNESQEVEEEDVKVRKKNAPKKRQKPEAVNKRKRVDEDAKRAKRKQSKVSKSTSDRRDEEGTGDSEDDTSDLSAQEPVKKKEIPKSAYGKQVERLKSVIKSCGMSISPAVYKKVKQAPESKREACLIKELEEILVKEGLSTNPSEKEIKDVKKRKERAKELEGIDMSNIVSSSRRRSTASFIPPPKPKIPDLSESDSEDSENEDDEDEEGDEEVEDNEEADEDQKNGGNDSQSEESDKGNSDSD